LNKQGDNFLFEHTKTSTVQQMGNYFAEIILLDALCIQ